MMKYGAACDRQQAIISAENSCSHADRVCPDSTCQPTEHLVFPGIKLTCHKGSAQGNIAGDTTQNSLIGIYHCQEGRMECCLQHGFCYVTPGDLLIARACDISQNCRFPLGHYQGISILIDTDKTPPCLSCFLEDVTVQPQILAGKFCSEGMCFVVRANPSVEHIFSELYSVPAQIQKGYFKIKVLELLLFLSVLDPEQIEIRRQCLTKTQADLAQLASQYLTAHMDEHITIEQLAEQFHVSGTYIRNSFKSVYGVSVYSFIRTRKMESAAYMLEHTDKSILEIASFHGYNNGSKFASAFRDVMGMTPREYRCLQFSCRPPMEQPLHA